MAKIDLQELQSLTNEQSAITLLNSNFEALEDASDNFLSLDGTTPNAMAADLDMDSNRILNLPTPLSDAEPATKAYVDALGDLASVAGLQTAVDAAEAAQEAAETAATNAQTYSEGFSATSTTTLTPSVASKTFTTQSGKSFVAGDFVLATSDADATIYMHGQVTSYSGTSLEVNVLKIGTATEKSDWTIRISGSIGATGATGADYTADAELNALSSLTSTPGLLTQTVDNTFTTRTITGTSGLISVTDGDGVSGNPTITVGSNVVRKDDDNTLASGSSLIWTANALPASTAAGTINLSFSDGEYQTQAMTTATGARTFNAPNSGNGTIRLLITNTTGGQVTITVGANGNTAVKELSATTLRTFANNAVKVLELTRVGTYVYFEMAAIV